MTKKKKRASARLCTPPACSRITLRTLCDRCRPPEASDRRQFIDRLIQAIKDNTAAGAIIVLPTA